MVVDSSPIYGSAEDVIGYCLDKIGKREFLFGTTKVWTPLIADGEDHMSESRALWGVEKFDLMQVHNLVNWAGHLETLSDDTAAGRVRHIGITTSHGSRHSQMARVMANPRVDAVQLTYNITDRSAEQRLLPLAAEPVLALVINRPFRRGELFRRFARHPLPEWAAEIECTNWAQFFLKFVILHPAVTCATPADLTGLTYEREYGRAVWRTAGYRHVGAHSPLHRVSLNGCSPIPPRSCSPYSTNTIRRSGRCRALPCS